jgi:hypothetical protein
MAAVVDVIEVFEAWMGLVLFEDAFVVPHSSNTKASLKRTKAIQASKTAMEP